MRIVFLNVWNAKTGGALAEFLREQAPRTDVFCFQEAYGRARKLFAEVLPGHRLAGTARKIADLRDGFAQATYVAAGIEAGKSEAVLARRMRRCGLGLCTPVRFGGGFLHVLNFHGLAQPGAKLDDPDRLRQSHGLLDFLEGRPGPKIVGGDFNLMPETESVRMFMAHGYRDLVAEYGIKTTRNRLIWEKFPDSKQYFSDYVFTSPEVRVEDFQVPQNEVSDHLPLIVDVVL